MNHTYLRNISDKHIILFDGECSFCNYWVRYIIKRDRKDLFRFAALKSEVGIAYQKQINIDDAVDSIILIEQEDYYLRSTAAFRILRSLGGAKSMFYVFIVLPVFIRDSLYNGVARYRNLWSGDAYCQLVLDKNMKNKFLT